MHQIPGYPNAEFFFSFTQRRGARIFLYADRTLGNLPGTDILVPPEWAARMNKENLQLSAGAPEDQYSSALLWHGRSTPRFARRQAGEGLMLACLPVRGFAEFKKRLRASS
jgi:hypothetical protein